MTEEAGERVWAATETAEAPSGGAVQVVETAAALIPSERTVAKHLDRIFAKLGVSSRTAVAAFTLRCGLA